MVVVHGNHDFVAAHTEYVDRKIMLFFKIEHFDDVFWTSSALFTLSRKRPSDVGLGGGKYHHYAINHSDLLVKCCKRYVSLFLHNY